MKNIATILLFVLLVGCASKSVVYRPPDSAAMDASTERLHKAVVAAKATHIKIQSAVAEVKAQVTDEKTHIDVLAPKLDELFRIAPVELRDEIDAARKEVTAIREDNSGLQEKVSAITALQATHGGELEEANAADKQSQADKDDYKKAAGDLAQKASDESARRAAAENKVHELESKNWIRRALEALAGIAILAVGFLYFTGKLTLNTAARAVIP